MRIIYPPGGRAAEDGKLAANLRIGCDHGCVYCYAPIYLKIPVSEFRVPRVRPDTLGKLAADARKIAGSTEPVFLCFVCDPYMRCEEHDPITRQAIQILHENDVPVRILTKGGKRSRRDFDLLGDRDSYGATLTFTDWMDSRKWEPEAALPHDRIAALSQAHHLGIPTWASLEPVIDPAQTLELIRCTHEFVDHYIVGKLNYQRSSVRWAQFARDVLRVLHECDASYYLKNDLHHFCDPGTPQRRVAGERVARRC